MTGRSERPILFSGPMARAILAGEKTMTRRVMKVPPVSVTREEKPPIIGSDGKPLPFADWFRFDDDTSARIQWLRPGVRVRPTPRRIAWAKQWHREGYHRERGYALWSLEEVAGALCPYGTPGDRLWVREAWRVGRGYDEIPGSEFTSPRVHYGAEGATPEWAGRYRHARFMPRWASRLTLAVESVAIERVQAISDEDVAREGITRAFVARGMGRSDFVFGVPGEPCVNSAGDRATGIEHYASARDAFAALWTTVNGRESWEANPWCWVIGFRRVEAQIEQGGGR